MNKKERKEYLKSLPSRSMNDDEWKKFAEKEIDSGIQWLLDSEDSLDHVDESVDTAMNEKEKDIFDRLTKEWTR